MLKSDYESALKASVETAVVISTIDEKNIRQEDIEYAADCLCAAETGDGLMDVDADTKAMYMEKAEEYILDGTIIMDDSTELEFEAHEYPGEKDVWDPVREDVYQVSDGEREITENDLSKDDIYKNMNYKDISYSGECYIDKDALQGDIDKGTTNDEQDVIDKEDTDIDNEIDDESTDPVDKE